MRDFVVVDALDRESAEALRAGLARQADAPAAAGSGSPPVWPVAALAEATVGHGGGRAVVDASIRRSEVTFPDPAAPACPPEIRALFAVVESALLAANEAEFGLDLRSGPEGAQAGRIEWQYTRYARGGDYYRQHCDCSFSPASGIYVEGWEPGKGYPEMRKLSASLLLSDHRAVRGGTFALARGHGEVPALEQGDMVVFPSFVPHSVSPILRGTRESLVCWVWGPPYR